MPEREVQSFVMIRGPYGGNFDVRDFRQGSTVYVNSYRDGGLLYAGDCHASQADTEYHGMADECRGEYVLSCEIIKNKRISHRASRHAMEDSWDCARWDSRRKPSERQG